ncbi:MAG: DUF1989 domain-containing protein, partial [Pseudomonadota bacterium]
MLYSQGAQQPPRQRYSGLKPDSRLKTEICWGEVGQLDLPAGTIVSLKNVDGAAVAWLTTLSQSERDFTTTALDTPQIAAITLDPGRFDARMMTAVAASRDSRLTNGRAVPVFDSDTDPGEVFVTRLTAAARLFVIAPVTDDFISGGGGGRFVVEAKLPDTASADLLLPEPLGEVRDEWRVNRATASAYELKKGQFVQIIDVEGQQCSDFMAMRADALADGVERYIDSTVSRTMARSAYPMPGLHDKFFDQDIKPLLAVRQDTVGRHDTFALACTARGYEERGFPGHINCSDNISDAFDPYGIQPRRAWPAINFFFNSWIDWQNHHISTDEAWSRPGDYVAMQALTDLVCVSTACPDDVDPINGWNPTDIHIRIYEEDSSIAHAVVWRAQPEDEGIMTRQSPFHPRTSKLT